jgi:hypothetical protein
MKRLLVFVLALLVVVPSVDARRKKKRAGTMDGSTYIDSKYGFTFEALDNWKANVQKEGSRTRVILTQTNYDSPEDYRGMEDYTAVPRLVIWVDTSTMGPFPLMDSLLSETYNSEQKKDMAKEFEFFAEPDITPRGRSRFELDGEKGVAWEGESKYIKDVQSSASASGGKRVYGGYGATVMIAKKDDLAVVQYMMCEKDFYDAVVAEVLQMAATFKWGGGDEQADAKE